MRPLLRGEDGRCQALVVTLLRRSESTGEGEGRRRRGGRRGPRTDWGGGGVDGEGGNKAVVEGQGSSDAVVGGKGGRGREGMEGGCIDEVVE